MVEQEWQVAILDDIKDPGTVEFKVGEGDWPFRGMIVRWQSEVYAYANSCAHAGHPLNFQPDKFFNADTTLLMCSSHGAVFEPATGLCVAGPCIGASLESLVCRVENGKVFVIAPNSLRA